jgi:uncharacterized cupin superfamily protein
MKNDKHSSMSSSPPSSKAEERAAATSVTSTIGGHSYRGAIKATDVPEQTGSVYPEPFRHAVAGRGKRKLGDFFGLSNFGVNCTTLPPGGKSSSALKHCHKTQDEFVYILEGTATCSVGDERFTMEAGDCIGFPKNTGVGHCVTNLSNKDALVFLEIGDRSPADVVDYPGSDLKAVEENGQWKFLHKDGTPY